MFVSSGTERGPYPALEIAIFRALKEQVKAIMYRQGYLVDTVLSTNPDLVLIFHGIYRHKFDALSKDISSIRKLGFKTAIWLTDDPYYSSTTKALCLQYDYVFTQDRGSVSFYKECGAKKVFFLPLATDPKAYRPLEVNPAYQSDICFIGVAFDNRLQFIDSIADYLSTKNVKLIGPKWNQLNHYSRLKEKIILGKWLKPKDTARYYNGAKIVLNLHRLDADKKINKNKHNIPAFSINNRTFEILSCKTFQLTDMRPDLEQFYTPQQEIETFNSADLFIKKAEYYLKHHEERNQVAIDGYRKTLQENTYDKRIQSLLKHVRNS
nr:glycosyltransferase [Polycladospora coralii]